MGGSGGRGYVEEVEGVNVRIQQNKLQVGIKETK